MKVLVIGRGGREHALVHMCQKSPLVDAVYCAPGSDAIGAMAELLAIEETDIATLAATAEQEAIDLTIVGPEVPLLAGIVDEFESRGLKIFGPTKAAAALEGSKSFAKAFMVRHDIPTAAFEVVTKIEQVVAWCAKIAPPYVLKADGLAAGKGVVIATSKQEAIDTAISFFTGKFGEAGKTIVLEEYLVGEECSFMVLANGETYIPLPISQDHKRLLEGDKGPNTGGMGVIAPLHHIAAQWQDIIEERIIRKTLQGMASEGNVYRGVLYAGLMITASGPKVIEFNTRFGDPETQVVLPMAKSDMVSTMMDLLEGNTPSRLEWTDRYSIGVVLASTDYPESSTTGAAITLSVDEEVMTYHAGTQWSKATNGWQTNGGRVALMQTFGDTVTAAQDKVYESVDRTLAHGNLRARKDIGNKLIESVSERV